jgi:rod shape-determining protein MreC
MYPVLYVQHKLSTPIKECFQLYKTVQEMADELAIVRAEKESLQAELIALKSTEQYHENIKELLDFKKRYSSDFVVIGQIIFKHFSPQIHFFLVDRGSKHGIQVDMIAVYNNCLIGRVCEVYPWYCKVVAITDSSCKVAAYCDYTKACGIHVGVNQLEQTNFERVSHLLSVKNGDMILSSGEGLVFPHGFGLGRVKECKKEGLWNRIVVEPLVNLKELSSCALLHKGATN